MSKVLNDIEKFSDTRELNASQEAVILAYFSGILDGANGALSYVNKNVHDVVLKVSDPELTIAATDWLMMGVSFLMEGMSVDHEFEDKFPTLYEAVKDMKKFIKGEPND